MTNTPHSYDPSAAFVTVDHLLLLTKLNFLDLKDSWPFLILLHPISVYIQCHL